MVYLDNNASTPIDLVAQEAMNRVLRDCPGNPGSRHLAGRRARQALENARDLIASILDARPQEVIFTSGGTEASNLALYGFAAGCVGTILLPGGEHPATEEPVRNLVASGWERREIPLQSDGLMAADSLGEEVLVGVKIATAILAHNETGVIQDLSPLSMKCLERGIPFHVDAVQAVGKIPLSFRELRCTTLALGAHKFHGPRGVGALLIREGIKFPPLLRGGFQEGGLRAGTEPVALAVGMSIALENWSSQRAEYDSRRASLRGRLEASLLQRCAPAVVNGTRESRLSNTCNISFPGCDADGLLIALDLAGVCVSIGSACASGSVEPSPVLLAMGLPPERYRSAIRLSVSIMNTESEIDEAIELISSTVNRLRNAGTAGAHNSAPSMRSSQ